MSIAPGSGRTFALLLLGLVLLSGCRREAAPTELVVEVFNPHAEQWLDAPVTLRLENYAFTPAPYARVYRDHADTRTEIPSQLDDLPDALFFLVDLDANETARYVVAADSLAPVYPRRAAAMLLEAAPSESENALLRQVRDELPLDSASALPGLIWESERVAYRTSGLPADLTDVLGKLEHVLLLAQNATGGEILSSTVVDVLNEGNTLGLGMPALATREGFVPLTHAGDVSRVIVANGPLRAIVRTTARGVAADEVTIDVVTESEIVAGSRWTEQRIRISDTLGTRQLITGIPRAEAASRLESGSVHGRYFVYTLGPQSTLGDLLGIALMIPSRLHPRLQPAVQVDHRLQFAAENEAAVYRYMATWEREAGSERALTNEFLLEEITREALRWNVPVQVTVQKP